MILYSLAPLAQQILPQEHAQNAAPTFTCSLSGGFLRGTMTERGFLVTGICSTDPAVYLKAENDIGTLRNDILPPQTLLR